MRKSQYKNADEHIFYCNKSNWYEINHDSKDWSQSRNKIDEFWTLLREEKMAKQDYDFSLFIFPKLTANNFWNRGQEKKFHKEVDFTRSIFLGELYLANVEFSGGVFHGVKFYEDALLHEIKVLGSIDFSHIKYYGRANFIGIEFFQKVNFAGTQFSRDARTVFSHCKIYHSCYFRSIIFPETVEFQLFNFERVAFLMCDFTKANFLNCQFKREKNRIVFFNNKGNEIDLLDDYYAQSNMYRQLKINRINAKDWINAGDAYRSEMVLMRRSIWSNFLKSPIRKFHLLFNVLIRLIYEYGSGYHQSLTKPLFWLVCLIFLTPFVLCIISDQYHYLDGVKLSINAALPIIGKIDSAYLENIVYFILVLERLIAVTLLALFILATRARLRQ